MTGIDMVTMKPDEEGVQCGQCGGPIVRPYPCHQGCESQVGGGDGMACTKKKRKPGR